MKKLLLALAILFGIGGSLWAQNTGAAYENALTTTTDDCVEFGANTGNLFPLLDAGFKCGTALVFGSTTQTLSSTAPTSGQYLEWNGTNIVGASGSSTTFEVNGSALSSSSTVNFENSAATDGLTLTVTNPSAGNVQLGFTGSLSNSGLANSSTTVNGQTCTLGSTCTVSGAENTQTASYTLVAGDLGKLVLMNCSSACTVTLYGSPTNGYYGAVESIGSTLATVSLNSKDFNGSTSVPALNSYRPLWFWSDGTNYFGKATDVAGSGITLTPASNGLTVSLTSSSITVGGTTCSLGSSCFPSDTTVAVSSGTQGADSCSSTTEVAWTGLTTSMSINPGYSASPSSLTGWGSTGGMVFQVWPQASGEMEWEVCNQTSASITYSAITFNLSAR